MTNYDILSKFYDGMMGDRSKKAGLLGEYIKRANPKTKNVLELACGTGAVLKHLSKKFEVSGLDLSKGMLDVAKKEVPKAKLYHQNMANFKMSEKFDAILCVFDSINHLLKFNDWKKLFLNVERHLNDGGVFIFDINIEKELGHISQPIQVYEFNNNFLILKISDAGKNIYKWNMKIFERQKNNQYLLHEENIKESSFSIKETAKALKSIFKSIKIINANRNDPKRKSDRYYFICKK